MSGLGVPVATRPFASDYTVSGPKAAPWPGRVGGVGGGRFAEERFTAIRWDFCKPAKPGAEFETAAVYDCPEPGRGGV
jgi:hypothetical protein